MLGITPGSIPHWEDVAGIEARMSFRWGSIASSSLALMGVNRGPAITDRGGGSPRLQWSGRPSVCGNNCSILYSHTSGVPISLLKGRLCPRCGQTAPRTMSEGISVDGGYVAGCSSLRSGRVP